jgi:hypothetical protein
VDATPEIPYAFAHLVTTGAVSIDDASFNLDAAFALGIGSGIHVAIVGRSAARYRASGRTRASGVAVVVALPPASLRAVLPTLLIIGRVLSVAFRPARARAVLIHAGAVAGGAVKVGTRAALAGWGRAGRVLGAGALGQGGGRGRENQTREGECESQGSAHGTPFVMAMRDR